MRFPPFSVMETWPPPNFVDPVTRGPALLVVELTIMPLALLCVALRLFIRIHWLQRSWWDDWLMVAASFFAIGVTVCVVLATQLYGWNIHVWDLTIPQVIQGRQVSVAAQTLFLFASGLAKLSILVSYLRIAPQKSLFRRLSFAAIVLITLLMPVFLIVLWTQCRPMTSYWDLEFTTKHDCVAEGPPILSQSICTAIADVFVYILPMPTLLTLKLPVLQRLVLMILFGMGAIVVFAVCMRIYWVHVVLYQTYDVTWEGYDLWIWTAVEVNLGVICGCIPSLKPLLLRWRHGAAVYGGSISDGLSPKCEDTDWHCEGEAEDEMSVLDRLHEVVASVHDLLPRPDSLALGDRPPTIQSFLFDSRITLFSPKRLLFDKELPPLPPMPIVVPTAPKVQAEPEKGETEKPQQAASDEEKAKPAPPSSSPPSPPPSGPPPPPPPRRPSPAARTAEKRKTPAWLAIQAVNPNAANRGTALRISLDEELETASVTEEKQDSSPESPK